jgi:NAD(P)-dependent dehydrogenase (short-subunit alcohol dehydrogenase family)
VCHQTLTVLVTGANKGIGYGIVEVRLAAGQTATHTLIEFVRSADPSAAIGMLSLRPLAYVSCTTADAKSPLSDSQ